MNFQTEKRYKTIRNNIIVDIVVIFQAVKVVFAVLARYVAADHINRSCCRTRSIDHQRVQSYVPFHSIETCARMAIRDSLWKFFAYKKNAMPN